MAKSKTRVLLADDHIIVRMGLASIMSFEEDIALVGEADDGLTAVELAAKTKPDVIVMDLMMPKMDGTEATRRIRVDNPDARVLILTSFATAQDLRPAMEAGAWGILAKTSSQDEIIGAIRRIAAGEHVFGEGLAALLNRTESGDVPQLSSRQIEVLGLAARGFTNPDIAKAIGISVNGVKDHLKQIYARLGVSSRAEATTQALSLHLITPSA